MSAPTYPVSVIAKLFNLTERRVQQMASEGIIPRPERGKYELVGCVRGYIAFLQTRAFGKESTDTGNIDAHLMRSRLLKAQAEKAELEVKTLQSELIHIDDIEDQWSGMAVAFRTRMLSIPTRGAHLASGVLSFHEIEKGLRELVTEALLELSLYEPRTTQTIQTTGIQTGTDLQNSTASSTTTNNDGESVGR